MADNTTFPRGECPRCHQAVALTLDGTRTHRHPCVDPNRDGLFYEYGYDHGDYVAAVEIDSGYIIGGELTGYGRDARDTAEQRRLYFAAAKRLVAAGRVSPSQVERPHVLCYDLGPKDGRKGMWVPLFVWVSEEDVESDRQVAETADPRV